jgi:organic hydroperoxide reductase OsmC/OhrA
MAASSIASGKHSYGCTVEWSRHDAPFSYRDAAQARMGRFPDGLEGITEVVLRPDVRVSGTAAVDDATIASLHHDAHAHCAIAHSLRGEVRIEGSWRRA